VSYSITCDSFVPVASDPISVRQRIRVIGQSLSITSNAIARPGSQAVTRSFTVPLGFRAHWRDAPTPSRAPGTNCAAATKGL